MKRALSVLLLLGLSLSWATAQEEPIPPKRPKMAKVGLFGGFTPGWLFVDVKPYNEFIAAGKGAPLKENGMLMLGGAGAIYIMVVPNLRVGGLGMSGNLSSTTLDQATGVRRDADLNVGFGGVTVEYVVPLAERLDLAVGAMLGGGGADLTVRSSLKDATTWKDESGYWASWPPGAAPNNTRKLSGSFFIYIPSASLEYALSGWLAVRATGSYVGMAFPSWSVDGENDLVDVPGSASGRGFMASIGILVGTF